MKGGLPICQPAPAGTTFETRRPSKSKTFRTMQKGKINVQTENIFPIIKKFLYSDHEIFLRELVSNAVDATQKLKALASMGEFTGELGNTRIEILLDAKKKTLTIRDRGIGMTADEVDRYINQIAFSSAEEFVNKYKGKTEAETTAIIGHFGLGFYSSFMVSDKVEIHTLSHKPDAEPVRWECDGSPDYTLEPGKKKERGTDIILHISDESKDYLEEYKILELLKKYCKFLPVEIEFGVEKTREKIEGKKDKDGNDEYKEVEKPRVINNPLPAWTRKPADMTDEDYKKFYNELYPYTFEEPLFHIHLNVDYPFNLTGILYFPKVKDKFEIQKNKIQLYSNQVFVTDQVEGVVPDFLTLLHGVIDSPDIPLNVSRSYLQSDPNVKKISGHIAKKVADKLEEMFKNDREAFEKKWNDIKVFIAYGMIADAKFYERAEKFCLFQNTEEKFFTFGEYKEHIKENQTDKEKNLVYLYTNNPVEQHAYVEAARERGYDVLIMDGVLDSHFINNLEPKFEKSKFVRVDADVIDKLIEKDQAIASKLSDEQKEKLKPLFEEMVDKTSFHVQFENMSETDQPVIITQTEFMRRYKEMSQLGGGGMGFMGSMPDSYNLVVNANHPLIGRINDEPEEENKKQVVKQLTDLALLSQGLLKGAALTQFIRRSVDMID